MFIKSNISKMLLLFLAMLCGLQNLSSLTRHLARALGVKVPSPNHWTAREFPRCIIFSETEFNMNNLVFIPCLTGFLKQMTCVFHLKLTSL